MVDSADRADGINSTDNVVSETALAFVAARIVERYAHPSRTAHLYLFRVKPGMDFTPIIPDPAYIITAWVDEGAGLIKSSDAVAKGTAAFARLRDTAKPFVPTSATQRRQLMARSVLFCIEQHTPAQISVDLFSRALAFTPKGDRRVMETWRESESGWYSAPVGRF